jgi:hypothetical protein
MSLPESIYYSFIVGGGTAQPCVRVRSLLVLFVTLVTACSGISSRPPTPAVTAGSSPAALLYVVRRGWHIDVGLRVEDLQPPLQALGAEFPSVRYLIFGFGDRHYLMARNHHGFELLAALWPGPGLMLVTALKASPQAAFGADEVLELPLSADQLQSAQAFIWQALSEQAQISGSEAPGPYEGSRYFGASARYSAFHTCNTWAAEAIRAAGWPVRTRAVIFAGQLWGQLRHLLREDQNMASAALEIAP